MKQWKQIRAGRERMNKLKHGAVSLPVEISQQRSEPATKWAREHQVELPAMEQRPIQKRARLRKTLLFVDLISTNNLDCSVIMMINGSKCEIFLGSSFYEWPPARPHTPGRILRWLKQRAVRTVWLKERPP